MKKTVAVYTSTRAEFGLLKPLIEKLKNNKNIEVRIFVTGTHLSADFGLTVSEIEKDFKNEIYYRVEHSNNEDSQTGTLNVMSEALIKYGQALSQAKPDLAIVLGDRYEALCFGIACSSLHIPIVHIHGGELTFGALDDKFRHCLTKLSDWHMVACEEYRKRVIQMGEYPETVFNTGALGIDNSLNLNLLSKDELQKNLNIEIPDELYLFTFHPETNSPDFGLELLQSFLKRVEERLNSRKALLVITGTNSDAGSGVVREALRSFVAKNQSKTLFVESLGVVRYLSVMRLATAVLGNSSSGVLEAFSLKTPTVNLGSRQNGRVRDFGVVDLPDSKSCVSFDFDRVIELKKQLVAQNQKSLLGDGTASEIMQSKIVSIAAQLPLNKSKGFHDLNK